MAFKQQVVPIATTDTVIFTCPAGSSGSVHGLVIANTSAAIRNLSLKFFSQSTGLTTTMLGAAKPIAANSEFIWYKPINVNPGDSIIGVASLGTQDLVASASIYLDLPAVATPGFNPRGDWSGLASYAVNEVVTIAGSSYIAQAPSTNSQPPSVHWMLSAQTITGPQGIQGVQGVVGPIGLKGDTGNTGPTGAEFRINAIGTLAGRSTYDAQSAGFVYSATDTGQLFIRETATAGVWSVAIPFQGGKGDTGATGATGDIGLTGAQGIQGIQGIQGERFSVRYVNINANKYLYDDTPEGTAFVATDTGYIYFRITPTAGVWTDPAPLTIIDTSDGGGLVQTFLFMGA